MISVSLLDLIKESLELFIKANPNLPDTAYKMLIASYITPDNLGLMKETSKEAIEYIITQITTSIQSLR